MFVDMTNISLPTSGAEAGFEEDGEFKGISMVVILCAWFAFALACVRMCDLRFVDCANFLEQPSKGQT